MYWPAEKHRFFSTGETSVSQTQTAAGAQESGMASDAQREVKVIAGLRRGRVIRSLKPLEIKAGASPGKKLNTLKREK